MTAEPTPPRRPLATFLHGTPATPAVDAKPLPAVPHDADPAEPREAAAAAVTVDSAPAAEALEATAEAEAAAEPAATHQDDPAWPPAETVTPDPAPATGPVQAPSFLRTAAPAHRGPTPRWQWIALATLALLLLLQIAIADRANLAASASTRPLISGLCTVLRCSVPAWHEPAAFTMLSRDIRQIPGQAGALQVQASFRNDARWAQAWPALRLSLSDADGRVIGRRTLQPADYLAPGSDPQARLEPGQSAQVSFRLREPAAATVAFSFEFQ